MIQSRNSHHKRHTGTTHVEEVLCAVVDHANIYNLDGERVGILGKSPRMDTSFCKSFANSPTGCERNDGEAG